MTCAGTGGLLSTEMPFAEAGFWQAMAALLTAYASYFVLVFLAAAARLTFASDNRSTRLRIVMLLQQLLFTGWITWIVFQPDAERPRYFHGRFLILLGLHWYAMGTLMTGESPELSARVKRNLPQSFLGRAMFTWFNPGPGTGYMFALANCAGTVVLILVAVAGFAELSSPGWQYWMQGHGYPNFGLGAHCVAHLAVFV